ncbi:T9SS type A sorting domain-containing protein [candidate division KSB1 bacterium]|nr:T9SS type A sorting domain-containing protein [candidate division KSB1 bacterium]
MKFVITLTILTCTISAVAQITPLVCDKPITDTISTIGEVKLYSFEVAPGEIFKITVNAVEDSSHKFQPEVRIIDRNGDAAVSCGYSTLITPIDCGPLSPAGNPYMAEVSDFVDDETGSFYIHLQRLTTEYSCDDTWLNMAFVHTDTIEHPVDSDLLSFNVPSQGYITFNVEEVNRESELAPYVRVLDRYGYETPGCESYHLIMPYTCGPLYTAGNPHRLEVTDFFSDDTGLYHASLSFLSSGVDGEISGRLIHYNLEQNYPNPFNLTTQIHYAVASDGFLFITIYNMSGQTINQLYAGHQIAGYHSLVWDGRNASGQVVPSGVYLCHMKSGDFEKTIEMILTK